VSSTVVLIGNVATEIQRYDYKRADGEILTKIRFLLAIDQRVKERPDGSTAPPDWIPVEVWGATARAVVEWNRKGSKLAVTGRIQGEFYQPEGAEKATLQIAVVAETVEFLTPKPKDSNGAGAEPSGTAAPSEAKAVVRR